MQNMEGPGSAVVIAYGFFTLYGVLMGLLIGWFVWG